MSSMATPHVSPWAWLARLDPRSWRRKPENPPLPIREGKHLGTGQAVVLPRAHMGLVWVVLCLSALGLVMVYSASIALPESRKYAEYASTHFLLRQSIALAIALLCAWVAAKVPIEWWERQASRILFVTLLLLLLVLIPGIGHGVNGSHRWLTLGVLNFQPSELAKLSMAMYAASFMVRKQDVKESFSKAVLPMVITLMIVGLLLLREPDLGAFMVIAVMALGVLFLGGVHTRVFAVAVAGFVLAAIMSIVFEPYRIERVMAFMDPWDPEFARNKGWQMTGALIAFGRGEWFGQGLGASVQKQHYLPEAHTDFLLALIGEELGFIAVVAVIAAFFWLIWCVFDIGRQAIALKRLFAGLLAQGIGLWLAGQAFVNMAVNLGLFPTKGITLPLLSYGGSGLLMNYVALAVVVRVDMETRALMRGGRA